MAMPYYNDTQTPLSIYIFKKAQENVVFDESGLIKFT